MYHFVNFVIKKKDWSLLISPLVSRIRGGSYETNKLYNMQTKK